MKQRLMYLRLPRRDMGFGQVGIQTKKVDGRHRNESNLSSLALKHNPIAKPIDVTSGKASSVSPKALKLKDQDKELIAGRCTICLMVNDLQPMEDQSQRQLPKEHSGDPPQLSLTETDRIIDDCVLRHLRSCSNSEDSSPTPLQEDLVRDFRDAKGTNIAPRKLHATSRLRVKDDERQESSTHVPFLSSSLPVLQANLGTNLQVDALTPPSKSPQLSPLLGCKQPSGQEHQQGLVNESGSCASVFRPLEDYIINCFRTCDTLNNSFLSSRPSGAQHSLSEGTVTALHEYSQPPDLRRQREDTSELDAKTILLGDIAENGAWWSVKTQADPMYPYTQATGRSQATAPRGSQGTQAQDSISVLVPEISRSGAGTPAQLHAALGPGTKPSSSKALDGRLTYGNDWQIKAAAKIMSLLFEANNSSAHRHHIVCEEQVPGAEGPTPGCQSMSGPVRHTADALINATDRVSLLRACKRQRQLPTNAFYNTLLDYCDLVADFETWENRRASFSFCQYPMFLSVWAKIRILEYDARRQMEVKARQAFFNSIINRHAVSQYLVLRVRRECLVEDSLRGVSEAVGSGQEDIKKGLRIAFQGEEGVDAGGLRKEWFLLLVREVFDPEYGERAHKTASLASGLQQLLDYNGDVEETFCRDFVAEVDRYGQPYQVPLCPNGEKRAVTNSNRAEFVELYIKYLLDTSVSRQFEPLKRGFFSVCGGNALSLFRPEEIELLVRGSDEPLDVAMLQAVAVYDGWKKDEQTGPETVIAWFWELFAGAAPSEQRALLSFITGSDRLPAMGATSLIIKLTCLGNDTQRFPMARTCFNMVGLYRYCSKEQLSSKLWTAVAESEGFGLK
ncbi:MAG: hypothetical protein LQ338_004233 [Usnochroma carphineum]|nr:MAG: hypothetical protein LQ338_004233 [Usnochroma carphineum]